jgi:uncharacterized protein
MRLFWIIPYLILALLVFYTNFKITRFLPNHKILALLLTLLLIVTMIGWEFVYRYDVLLANKFYFSMLAWIGSTLFGVWVSFILFSIIVDCGYFIFVWVASLIRSVPISQIYNVVLAQWFSVIIFIISLIISGLGLKAALVGPQVVEVFIPVKEQLAALQKLKIVQISDLHIGAIIRRNYVEKIVQKVNELKPDLLVLTGDVADGTPRGLMQQIEPLANLHAPLGKFYVTGNHEYYWGAGEWVKSMRELGFIPLINENRLLDFAGAKILVGGVTDATAKRFLPSHNPDLSKAIFVNEPSDFKILLSHNPNTLCEAERLGFDLQLSGHTHAGQFFPFNLLVPLVYKHHNGLNSQKKIWLYINPSTGFWGPVNRFGIHSEITVIRFKSEEN